MLTTTTIFTSFRAKKACTSYLYHEASRSERDFTKELDVS